LQTTARWIQQQNNGRPA